jgi:type VI secretion system protein ImpK
LFQKGSAQIEAAYEPVVARITEALNSVPGTVIVRGHTDNIPIHTARFPSNWHLSQERAGSVLRLMLKALADPTRVKVEGLADANPVVKNDTPENQARNRRVEILLRVASR